MSKWLKSGRQPDPVSLVKTCTESLSIVAANAGGKAQEKVRNSRAISSKAASHSVKSLNFLFSCTEIVYF